MSMRRTAVTSLVVLAALTSTAEAQLLPRIFCPPGQVSCFAAAFSYANYSTGVPGYGFLDGTPVTVMSVYVQNLQGSYAQSSSSPFGLNTFGFFRQNGGFDNMENTLFAELLTPDDARRRAGTKIGNVRVGPRPYFVEDENLDPENYLSKTYSDYVSPGVMGCDLGRYRKPQFGWGWQTCRNQGTNGWVKFDFALWWAEQSGVGPRYVQQRDFFLTLGASNTPFDYSCGFGRKIGVKMRVDSCPSVDYDGGTGVIAHSNFGDHAVATPEPATLILLGTGLASLGAGAMRRRRRR